MNDIVFGKKDDVSVVLSGEAGQGIQTVEQILTGLLKLSGYNIFGTKEYMSRVRGGSNSTLIRVSSRRVTSVVDAIDILIPFDRAAFDHVASRVSTDTLIICEADKLFTDAMEPRERVIDIPFAALASEAGGAMYLNTVATGVVAGLFEIDRDVFEHHVREYFAGNKDAVIHNNVTAGCNGFNEIQRLNKSGRIAIDIKRNAAVADEILMNGASAIGIGAIAGGCNFIASYPMSPATAVLVFLAAHSAEYGIVVEQAEDEIAAINMALGAWFAGARAMVSTSGGGFALMEEAIGLAGMIESPIVVHLAQRPGPATGLPTRTEQGDLQLVFYAGHGEFPRIILAPGTLDDAVYCTHQAFNLADKFQVPVFIMTDQYLMDTYYNIPSVNLSDMRIIKYIVKTSEGYRRYELTDSGISPRGIPGFGSGFVCADSDEHDEDGHITEDLDLRVRMVDKRLAKLEAMRQDAIPPVLTGDAAYTVLVLGWGSTCNVIKEALSRIGRDDLAFLHFVQVYPLHPDTIDYLARADKVIMIEGNATAQLAGMLKRELDFNVHETILKYSGLQFSVEELVERIMEKMG